MGLTKEEKEKLGAYAPVIGGDEAAQLWRWICGYADHLPKTQAQLWMAALDLLRRETARILADRGYSRAPAQWLVEQSLQRGTADIGQEQLERLRQELGTDMESARECMEQIRTYLQTQPCLTQPMCGRLACYASAEALLRRMEIFAQTGSIPPELMTPPPEEVLLAVSRIAYQRCDCIADPYAAMDTARQLWQRRGVLLEALDGCRSGRIYWNLAAFYENADEQLRTLRQKHRLFVDLGELFYTIRLKKLGDLFQKRTAERMSQKLARNGEGAEESGRTQLLEHVELITLLKAFAVVQHRIREVGGAADAGHTAALCALTVMLTGSLSPRELQTTFGLTPDVQICQVNPAGIADRKDLIRALFHLKLDGLLPTKLWKRHVLGYQRYALAVPRVRPTRGEWISLVGLGGFMAFSVVTQPHLLWYLVLALALLVGGYLFFRGSRYLEGLFSRSSSGFVRGAPIWLMLLGVAALWLLTGWILLNAIGIK